VRLTWTFSRVCPGDEAAHGKYYGSDGTFVDTGFVMHPFQGGGEIHRADGSVVPYEEIEARYLASLSQEKTDRLFPYGATDGFSVEVWDFIHAIATGDPVELDGEAGLRAKALSIACYESATLGAPVRYDDVLAGRVRAYQEPIDAYWQLAAV
jgi:UDP-N-acetyl-2-amino-2-deoxyglucuronate dehydrogenase